MSYETLEPVPEARDQVRQILRTFAIADLCLVISSIFLNGFVVGFICRSKGGRAAVSMTTVSIAVSNMVIALLVIPTDILQRVLPIMLQPFLCKFSIYFDSWCTTAVVYSIVALHIDRFLACTGPEGNRFLVGHCMFYLSFVWFFGAAYSVWDLVYEFPVVIQVTGPNFTMVHILACRKAKITPVLRQIFVILDLVILFGLPLLILLCLVISVYKQRYYERRHAKRERRGHNSKWRLAMACIFTVTFHSCYLPHYIVDLMDRGKPYLIQEYRTKYAVRTLKFAAGAIFPTFYLICSNEVKVIVKRIRTRRSTRSQSVEELEDKQHYRLREL